MKEKDIYEQSILTTAPIPQQFLLYRKSRLFLLRYRNPATTENNMTRATVPE
jgi:hypothetical protein